jgi:glucose-1-phosphate thymidylyltransferase
MNFTYVVQNSAGGIGEALLRAKDFVGDRDMYVILGDNIFNRHEFDRPPTFFTDGCVFLKKVKDSRQYGVPEFDNGGRIVSIEEKPATPKSPYAVTGLYAYKNNVFSILEKLVPSSRGEIEISDLNDFLAKDGKLSFTKIRKEWLDAGHSPQGYVDAQYYLLKKWAENDPL